MLLAHVAWRWHAKAAQYHVLLTVIVRPVGCVHDFDEQQNLAPPRSEAHVVTEHCANRGELSKQAFDLPHRPFLKSVAAQRTKYWY